MTPSPGHKVPFVKMSGAGNDFIVLDAAAFAGLGESARGWIRRICRRGVSLGADGVLVVGPARDDRVAVRFFNPDASPAFCGNGSRCAARFARLTGLAGVCMVLETEAGEVPAEIDGAQVRLRLPPPVDHGPRTLEVDGASIVGHWVEAAVPHFVQFIDGGLPRADLARWGPAVRRHAEFGPRGVNFDLVERVGAARLAIRTWERGVEGETLACGSGAVAAAFAARLAGGPESVTVVPASGVPLEVGLPGPATAPTAATLVGDARIVCEGVAGSESVEGFAEC